VPTHGRRKNGCRAPKAGWALVRRELTPADSPLLVLSVVMEVMVRSYLLLPSLCRPTFVGASLPCSTASSALHPEWRKVGGAGPTTASRHPWLNFRAVLAHPTAQRRTSKAHCGDQTGDQRGGSEWELIKILLEGDDFSSKTYTTNHNMSLTQLPKLAKTTQPLK
jgi:hypothetical protein